MANQFQLDSNCKAAWQFNTADLDNPTAGHLYDVSGNGNHLHFSALTLDTDAADHKEGDAAGIFTTAGGVSAYLNDADLSTGFPLKSDDSVKKISITGIFRLDALLTSRNATLYSKYTLSGGRSLWLHVNNTSGTIALRVYHGHTSGTLNEVITFSGGAPAIGTWYFVAYTYDDADKSYQFECWDLAADARLGGGALQTGNAANSISLNSTRINSGIRGDAGGGYSDMHLDELAVFNDILTPAEIDLIRHGLYMISWQAHFRAECSMTADLNVISFAPSIGRWTWPVTERLRFNTEILDSHDRTEQRIAHHLGFPRQAFTTQVFIDGDADYAAFEAVLHGWLSNTWPIPLGSQSTAHTAVLPAGSSAIAIDTRYADYRVGSYAMIWQSQELYEIVEVAGVADAALTLSMPTVRAYSGSPWIMPCRIGWCLGAGRVERYRDAALIDLTWEVDVVDLAAVTGFAAAMTYDGMTVLTDPAYWPSDHGELEHDPDAAVLDAGTGPFVVVRNADFNATIQGHIWHPRTMQACWRLRQFLYAIKGCQTAFLVPTFAADLTLTRPCGSSDTSLYVANRGFTRNMGFNALRTYLAFRPPLADIIPSKVTGLAVISDAEERIDLLTAPGQAFDAGQSLCWVDKCRLASDDVTFEWQDRGTLDCAVKLVRVT